MSTLPQSWSDAPLLDLLETLESGARPKGGVARILEGVPSIGGEHLDASGGFKLDPIRFIPRDFFNSMSKGIIKTSDVLVVKDGATTGKVSLVRHDFPFAEAAVNEHVFICRATKNIRPDFLYYFMFSKEGQRRILANLQGTAQGGINQSFAPATLIPVAPINEQGRIVAKLDALFERSCNVRGKLEQIPALLDRLRKSILASAFRGDLTRAWRMQHPDAEPASTLLRRIRTERRKRWEQDLVAKGRNPQKAKYSEPASANTEGLPELPRGWCWASVNELSTKVVDGVHKKPSYVSDGVPFLTVKNLTAGRGISFDNCKYVTLDDHLEFCSRTKPEFGDLLISKDGTLGVVRAIRTDVEFSIFVSLALVKPVVKEMSDYLELAFSSPQLQEQMTGTGSGLQHIHLVDLREDLIPVAPLLEQQQIVKTLQAALAQIQALEKAIATAEGRLKSANVALLRKAFRGELVPQDPNDEPASALLERISAERSMQPATKRTRKTKTTARTA